MNGLNLHQAIFLFICFVINAYYSFENENGLVFR